MVILERNAWHNDRCSNRTYEIYEREEYSYKLLEFYEVVVITIRNRINLCLKEVIII